MADRDTDSKTTWIPIPKAILAPLLAGFLGLGAGGAGTAGYFGFASKQDVADVNSRAEVQAVENKLEHTQLELRQANIELKLLESQIVSKQVDDAQNKKIAELSKRR